MAQKKFRQGYYKPKNPEKYKGNTLSVIYRSSWERKVMEFFDTSRNIEWWNSEGLVIPYMSIDKKIHRYFPDFIFLNKKNELNYPYFSWHNDGHYSSVGHTTMAEFWHNKEK